MPVGRCTPSTLSSKPVGVPVTLVMRTLLVAIIVLHLLNLVAQSFAVALNPTDAGVHFAQLFTVNAEGKIPTWYSAVMLLGCAALLLAIALHCSAKDQRRRWFVLAGLFAMFSLDEAAGIHDEMSGYLHALMPTEGFLRSTWVIPAMFFVAALGVWMIPLLRSISRRTSALFILAGSMYVGGALGVEMIGAAYLSAHDLNMQSSAYALLATVEELLEMSGVIVFIYALLRHMQMQNIAVPTLRTTSCSPTCVLAVLVTIIFVAGIAGQISTYIFDHGRLLGFVRLFHLDGEGNATSWFSSMLLLSAAAVSAMCAAGSRPTQSPHMWWILAATFTGFSLDEFASLHELSIVPLRELWQTSGLLHFPWVIAGAVVAGCVFVLCARDLFRLPPRFACMIIASGAIFVSGSLGIEAIGGWWSSTYGQSSLQYECIVAGEELLEMIGIALFITTLLGWLRRNPIELRIGQTAHTDRIMQLRADTSKRSHAA